MSSPPRPAWQTALEIDAKPGDHYPEYVNPVALQMIDGEPRRVIDLGCAGGALGAAIKARHPGAEVIGVEASRAAAEKAAARLDRVICARLETLDLAAEGFGPAAFDTVIAADVLEHLVNPWKLLVSLKPFLSAGAQVIASIPNVRNLWLLSQAISEGRWEYTEHGLLDVTHLRFFTLEEMRRLFEETGYRPEAYGQVILPSLREAYAAYQGRGARVLKFGRLTVENVTPDEIAQFCAENFVLRCRVAS